ncbi:MAG: hydrogenase maturation protease [Thermoleophilia bacterium]|nr:hydrogenase maturation protease [Thermoleophilia bacterium]
MSAAVAVLGSRYRGDDAVGPLVGDRLREAGLSVLDCREEPTRLLDAIEGLDLLVVVDAVRSGAEPGTIHRLESHGEPLPGDLALASTHAFGIAETLELARALGRAPRRVVVLGVEGARFGLGEQPTPAVAAALDALTAQVRAELAEP